MTAFAIDLGTANSAVCRWNPDRGRPELVELPEVCRQPGGDDPLEAPRLVPSATHVAEELDLWTRLGSTPFLSGRTFWGRHGWIGRQALDRNPGEPAPAFVPSFKAWLGRASTVPLARAQGRSWTAREVAQVYLRELLAEVWRTTGERVRELVITAPVDSYDSYRAELSAICRRLGVKKLTFADEPVAAALGYGLGLRARRRVLVVDFGAGTLDLALVILTARELEQGRCEVVAKAGRSVGGDHVDGWILDGVLERLATSVPAEETFWRTQLLEEARRVKETSYVRGAETFHLEPPEHLARMLHHPDGPSPEVRVDQPWIRALCAERGLFDTLSACLDECLDQARAHGLGPQDVDDVLMVGGSTLLPGVYPLFEERFGRDRVRAWRPFEAVAHGAAVLASGTWAKADFIVHDYAIQLYEAGQNEPMYVPVVPRGTRFPTRPDFWRQQVVPTCALGEPERLFKLVICEIGSAWEDERLFGWDAQGAVHTLTSGEQRLVVPLNDHAPTLGHLDPPHPPNDRRPRLDIAFGVDDNRWLVATVKDLRSGVDLLREEPVVRLL